MIDKFQLKKLVSDDLKSAFDELEKILSPLAPRLSLP